MTELTHPHSPPAPRSRAGGFAWFAAMVGGWVVFYALVLFSEPTLHDLRDRLRDLPLLLEGLVWLLLFPYVLALTIWDSSWAEWLRFALVGCCALGWSLAFYPWRRGSLQSARTPVKRKAEPPGNDVAKVIGPGLQ